MHCTALIRPLSNVQDVVHFLRGQRNCFNNIIIALQDMRRDMTFAR